MNPVRDVIVALIIGVTIFNCVEVASRVPVKEPMGLENLRYKAMQMESDRQFNLLDMKIRHFEERIKLLSLQVVEIPAPMEKRK